METTRWRSLEDLFLQASELTGEARERLLDEVGSEDQELRREVESLLGADTDIEGHLADAIASTLNDAPPEASSGPCIERYEILRELGSGGMGTVFLARRDDRQYNLRAAIKVARVGLSSDEIRHRMRQERQILAGLDHPNICKLLDGGTTEDGMPYCVMEFIEGEPIDQYCARRELSIGRRLRLFRQVCDAVHYAHQKLVIHRDLKPSNLLVTREGVPKLLDFGIAKLLDPADPDPGVGVTTPLITQNGMRWLTPAFASPEQMRSEPLSTSSDVYSLGVLLYRLLTGQAPYDLERQTPGEMERIVCDSQPLLPSLAVVKAATDERARPHAKRLAGDLDNIVSMALRKDPDERYASADQLADDISRHLAGEPVRARPHTLVYRAGKFVRRNRVAVAAVVVVFLSLLIGFGTALWQGRIAASKRLEADQQRILAERNQHHAERQQQRSADLVELMIGIFEVTDPSEARGNSVTVREVLDSAVQRIREELAEGSLDRADMLDSLGRVYQGLGLYETSRPLLEEALEIRRTALGSGLEVAASQNNLAELYLGQDRPAEAEELLRHSLVQRQQLVGDAHPLVIESLINLGTSAAGQGRFGDAEDAYEGALAIQEQLLPVEHPDFIETLNNLASIRWLQQDLRDAEQLFQRSLELARHVHGNDHPDTVGVLANLTTVMHGQSKFTEAIPLAKESVELRRSLLGSEHPLLAASLNTLAVLLYEIGDFEAAEPTQLESLAIKRKKLPPAHSSTLSSLHNLAQLRLATGRYDDAVAIYRDVVEQRRSSLGEEHPKVARSLGRLAESLLFSRAFQEAGTTYLQALTTAADGSQEPSRQAPLLAGLGSALLLSGRASEAQDHLERSALLARDIEPLVPEWQEVRIEGAILAGQLALGADEAARKTWVELEPTLQALPRDTPREGLALHHLKTLLLAIESPRAKLYLSQLERPGAGSIEGL